MKNIGAAPAKNVILRQTLPAGFTLVNITALGWTLSTSGSALTAQLASLPQGQSATVTVQALANFAEGSQQQLPR